MNNSAPILISELFNATMTYTCSSGGGTFTTTTTINGTAVTPQMGNTTRGQACSATANTCNYTVAEQTQLCEIFYPALEATPVLCYSTGVYFCLNGSCPGTDIASGITLTLSQNIFTSEMAYTLGGVLLTFGPDSQEGLVINNLASTAYFPPFPPTPYPTVAPTPTPPTLAPLPPGTCDQTLPPNLDITGTPSPGTSSSYLFSYFIDLSGFNGAVNVSLYIVNATLRVLGFAGHVNFDQTYMLPSVGIELIAGDANFTSTPINITVTPGFTYFQYIFEALVFTNEAVVTLPFYTYFAGTPSAQIYNGPTDVTSYYCQNAAIFFRSSFINIIKLR